MLYGPLGPRSTTSRVAGSIASTVTSTFWKWLLTTGGLAGSCAQAYVAIAAVISVDKRQMSTLIFFMGGSRGELRLTLGSAVSR
jgi:hypothetical protein